MNKKLRFLDGKILSGRVYPEFFKLKSSDHVINLGCGLGPQSIIYAEKFTNMVCIDVNETRLKSSREILQSFRIKNLDIICADVESSPLLEKSFDKAIAIDIIEHVRNPKKMCLEINRLLKKRGGLLITLPSFHDKFTHFTSKIGNILIRRKSRVPYSIRFDWDPDAHNHKYNFSQWIKIVETCGFKFLKSRATTLVPPLHLYGIPRFWFRNNRIHKIDTLLCNNYVLKKYGQSLVTIFMKNRDMSIK